MCIQYPESRIRYPKKNPATTFRNRGSRLWSIRHLNHWNGIVGHPEFIAPDNFLDGLPIKYSWSSIGSASGLFSVLLNYKTWNSYLWENICPNTWQLRRRRALRKEYASVHKDTQLLCNRNNVQSQISGLKCDCKCNKQGWKLIALNFIFFEVSSFGQMAIYIC